MITIISVIIIMTIITIEKGTLKKTRLEIVKKSRIKKLLKITFSKNIYIINQTS